MYIRRSLESFVTKVTEQFPVLLVTGARQVGKTTFLQHLSNNRRTYVTKLLSVVGCAPYPLLHELERPSQADWFPGIRWLP